MCVFTSSVWPDRQATTPSRILEEEDGGRELLLLSMLLMRLLLFDIAVLSLLDVGFAVDLFFMKDGPLRNGRLLGLIDWRLRNVELETFIAGLD